MEAEPRFSRLAALLRLADRQLRGLLFLKPIDRRERSQ